MTARYLEKCNCSFRIRMVGDGCQYCNPEFWEEILREQEEDERKAVTAKRQEKLK